MSRSSAELNFFGIEKGKKPLDRRSSFKGIQNAISRIDPQVLKSVIASRMRNEGRLPESAVTPKLNETVPDPKSPIPLPSMRNGDGRLRSLLPVSNPVSRVVAEDLKATSPLTIFYNGTVTVYDVPRDMAEKILKVAVKGDVGTVESADTKFAASSSSTEGQLLEKLNDLPIARKHSLQRFLEKRKERV
ncbi:protein TIFY 9-like isoform X2 [Magnolia sinica]|uniref:protein TIFY 9-like isoform X2 n=1 Tax=Magnolia sinica TaxID=86752 RepID=UPI00265924BC|nr:protein TIFY 9-like isoform X2 [Magnolia sinica]